MFSLEGVKHVFGALPLRLVITRSPITSRLAWKSYSFRRVMVAYVDAVVIATEHGRRGSCRFAIRLHSGEARPKLFRSIDYWWSDREAIAEARTVAVPIAEFLECPLEIDQAVTF